MSYEFSIFYQLLITPKSYTFLIPKLCFIAHCIILFIMVLHTYTIYLGRQLRDFSLLPTQIYDLCTLRTENCKLLAIKSTKYKILYSILEF